MIKYNPEEKASSIKEILDDKWMNSIDNELEKKLSEEFIRRDNILKDYQDKQNIINKEKNENINIEQNHRQKIIINILILIIF